MRIGAYTLVVRITTGGDLGVVLSGDRIQMATWIDPKRFRACPRFVAAETAENIVAGSRAPVTVAELTDAIEAECRKALGQVAT